MDKNFRSVWRSLRMMFINRYCASLHTSPIGEELVREVEMITVGAVLGHFGTVK